MPSKAKLVQEGLKVLKSLGENSGLLKEALEAKIPPATTPRGGKLFPQAPMYTPDVPQVDLPRMKKVDVARAAGKKPAYTERMQSLLDSPTVRKKVDKLIEKGEELGMREWYGTEPLRRAAMEAGVSPEQYRAFMAQLASASQRNPVDQQNLMGSFLYHLQQSGRLPEESMLLTNKLRKQLRADPSLAEGRSLIELPSGYGSLAQSDIFERGRQIAGGDIEGALPPEAKLGTFYRNLLGNLRPVTVDVNAVRGPIIEQGDPRWLTSKLVEKDEEGNIKNVYFPRRMVEEGEMSMREAKQRPGFWEAAPSGSEYAGFEDLWQRAATRHGVEPAEAQALGWYGSGDITALKTKPELYIDNLERLIRRTAEIEGEHPLRTMERILRGETFLKKKEGGSIDLEAEFRNGGSPGKNAGRGMAGLTRSSQPISPQDVQAMMLDIPAGLGVPFAEAIAEALRGNIEEAKSSAVTDAALTAIPGVAVVAKPAYRAVKSGVKKAAPAVREAARGVLESGVESGVILDPRMQAIAYHGSPHKFEKFDASKIGTGEGAQAFGHGLYFAENPGVAQEYADRLGANLGYTIDGRPLNRNDPTEIAASTLHSMQGLRDIAIETLESPYALQHYPNDAQVWRKAAEILRNPEVKLPKVSEATGSFYTVDIPDELVARMLDWDKPLGEQPEAVQKALSKANIAGNASYFVQNPTEGTLGQLYSSLANQHGAQAVSDFFKSQGIPGIKYLDAGSRSVGEGTRNFVVFPGEEESVKILERKKKGGGIGMADGGTPKKYGTLEAIKDIAGGSLSNLESLARGSVAGLVGAPGDINELIRDTLGINPFPELPAAPTSERILKAVPRVTAPRKESEGMETLGAFVQPVDALVGAGKALGKVAKATEGMPVGLSIKPVGGQWLSGYAGNKNVIEVPYLRRGEQEHAERLEGYINDFRAKRAAESDPAKMAQMDDTLLSLNQELERAKKDAAIENWATVNLQNYARTQMGTPEDPILKMVEGWPEKQAQMLSERESRLQQLRDKKQAIQTGPVPPEVRDPDAWRQARVRSINEQMDQVNEDIERINEFRPLHMPVGRVLFKETAGARERAGFPIEGTAKTELGRAWENLTDSMIHSIEAGKLRDPDYMKNLEQRMMESRLGTEKGEPMSLEDIYQATRFGNYGRPREYEEMMRRDPWLSKVDPSTPIYKMELQFGRGRPEARDLGFDHVMDVLKADLAAGRIRPEQLSKMSVEQAVRRTAEYDAEKAVQMKKATAEEVKNLTVAKEFDDGIKVVQLDKPGQFAKESQRMGHSVEGYEPTTEHPDWQDVASDVGYSRYGHGGWDAIKSGKAQVFSIRDAKNMPHVTIEVGPPKWPVSPVDAFNRIGKKYTEAMDEALNRIGMTDRSFPEAITIEQRDEIQRNFDNALRDIFEESGGKMVRPITQIKGKRNEAPDEDYLPYIRKFIRDGNYVIEGDRENAGLFDTYLGRHFAKFPPDTPRYITESELKKVQTTGRFEPEFKSGGEVKMAKGGDMDLEAEFQKAGDETYASRGQRRYGDREKGMTASTALEALYNMTRRQAASELKGAGPRAVTDVANNILADTLGMPVDMVNMMLGTVGLGSKRPVGGSEQLRNLMREYGMTTGTERPLTETAVSLLGPGAPRAATKMANVATVAARRPFTPATLTVEATAPDLGQETSWGFRQGLNDALLAEMSKIGRRPATTREGMGAYVNEAGILETNPMLAVDIPKAGRIGEEGLHGDVTGAVRELRRKIAQAGVDLNQESMAAHRFIPLPVNDIRDASAMLIKTPEGLDKSQIDKLATLLSNNMVVAHNPRLGGIVVYPFGPVGKEIPKEFLSAQSAAKTVLGKKAQIHYGVSDYDADRLYMVQSAGEYGQAGAVPMSAEQAAKRERLQAMQKALFPDTSGIPGNVKAAPLGGIQGWSRGKAYPTHVQGVGIKPDWQAINYATEERGPLRSSIDEAQEDQMSLLDKYHRALVGRNR